MSIGFLPARLAALVLAGAAIFAPGLAAAQAPPAVPSLPDSERRTSYSISSSTCPACSVGFALYGDSTDYGSWIEVWIITGSGTSQVATRLTAVTDYTLSSATGSLASIPRPITDATITLTTARTGTLQIVGARRPRRTSQFAENRGVASRDLNQVITDIVATQRETWDRVNDVAGRALQTPPGDTIGLLPVAAVRAGGIACYDGSGNPLVCAAGSSGTANVVGPNVSVVGHIPVFANTTGTLLADGGLIGTGDVVGPASSTNGAIALFNGAGGKTLQNGPAGTTTTVLHGNASGTPSYGAVVLTTDVSGILPVANGGTALSSGTSGGILGYTASGTLASSVALTANALVLGGGAGATPTPMASLGTTTTVLHGNAAGAPTFGAVSLTADVSGILPLANGGTNNNLTASAGGIPWSDATKLNILAGTATANLPLLSGSAVTPSWAAITYPTSATSGGVPYFSSPSAMASSAVQTVNALMLGGGAGNPPSTPVSLGTTTTVLHGNAGGAPSFGAVVLTTDVSGVLPVANGGTGLASGTSGGVLAYTASGTLASSGALGQNQIVLGGGAGAAPTAVGSLGTANQVLHGNASGAPSFSAVSLSADVTGTLPLGSGGTGQTTAALARTSSGLNIDAVTTFGNASYSAAATDRVIATTSGFTAQRTVTLPTVASFNAGQQLVIVDSGGAINGANTLVIAANGADSINGVASVTISTQYSGAVLWPIGSNKWGYISAGGGGGSGTVTAVTAGAGLATGAGSSTISTSGTLYAVMVPQGRLTLQTATPVMTTSQSTKGTLYYDCYNGRVVPYYNGTDDASDTIASCEVSTAMQTSGTGVLNAGDVFDAWWVHSGANRICVATNGSGGGWASDTSGSTTARGTGYSQLDYTTRGYITNKNAITNCYNGTTNYGSISANQATYLGTICTDSGSAGKVSWTYGGTSAGGTAGRHCVWNMYNRVLVQSLVSDTTDNWSVGANTKQAMNGSTTNRVTYVSGNAEDAFQASVFAMTLTGAALVFSGVGIGYDSTSAASGVNYLAGSAAAAFGAAGASGQFSTTSVGLHFMQALDLNSGGSASTNYGDGGLSGYLQGGLTFIGRM